MQDRTVQDSARPADTHRNGAGAGGPRYISCVAETEAEVRAAQNLRYRVFAEEMGAQLAYAEPGLDCDRFDPYCDHLLVRNVPGGQVVGTYRMLSFNRAQKAGGFYTATEFDLRRLAVLGSRVLEVGRACVDPDPVTDSSYRSYGRGSWITSVRADTST